MVEFFAIVSKWLNSTGVYANLSYFFSPDNHATEQNNETKTSNQQLQD